MQATDAFTSAGAAAPDEFYDAYSIDVEAEGRWSRARRRFFQHRLAAISFFILLGLGIVAFFAERIAPNTYQEISLDALGSGPTWSHPFGTDQIGRDYFSRSLYGLRTEVEIAILIGFFGTVIGTLVGALAGYFGSVLDNLVMRLADLLLMLPPLITLIVGAAYLHTNTLTEVSLLLAAVLWMPIARIVRSITLSLREREYVEAARAMGASDFRIIVRHILPNAIGAVAVAASVMTAGAVILETTLSYLGPGLPLTYYQGRTQSAMPSLGDVMAAANSEGGLKWWGIFFPGLVVVLLVAPIYFVGDGIRDALDPAPRRYMKPRRRRRRTWLTRQLSKASDALPRPRLPHIPLPAIRLPRFSTRYTLVLEALGILVVTAAVAAGIYSWKVNPVESLWAAEGINVQNVSRAVGAQTEASISVAQGTGAMLGASNDTLLRTIRVYTSTDAGATWTSTAGPPLGADACARGEPSTAIDGRGRQYVAFIVNGFCTQDDPSPYLVAASRAAPGASWTVRRVAAPPFADSWDDKPALAAGERTVYAVWSRLQRWTHETMVVSSTRDGGRTWSKPHAIPGLSYPRLVSAVFASGALFVTGIDQRFGVWLARSSNEGRTFRVVRVARLPGNPAERCAIAGTHPTPFSPARCLGPNPSVAATAERVFVTYGIGGPGEPQSVRVGTFDRNLRKLSNGVPAAGPDAGDRFWPASAVDATNARLWVCFYDTTGDPSREQAWYSCTASWDGTRWTKPVRAAADSANAEVLWEDARLYQYGDVIGYGGYTGVAATSGSAQPVWIDTRDRGGNKQEIFTGRLDDPGYNY